MTVSDYLDFVILFASLGMIALIISVINHKVSRDERYDCFSKSQWASFVRFSLFFTLLSPVWPVTVFLIVSLPAIYLFKYAFKVALNKE